VPIAHSEDLRILSPVQKEAGSEEAAEVVLLVAMVGWQEDVEKLPEQPLHLVRQVRQVLQVQQAQQAQPAHRTQSVELST